MKRCARLPPSFDGANEGCERGEAPNKRLKLAAPGVYSRIPFVPTQSRRRSLSAVR
jgi:hypothetical protein